MARRDEDEDREVLPPINYERPLEEKEQAEIARRLQTKWLLRVEDLLDSGRLTSTDLATIARVLLQNGWTLDPSKLPQDLANQITSQVDPKVLDEEDVIPLRKKA